MAKSDVTSSNNAGWQFVHSNGPKVPADPAVRRRIRQQAMRDVAIARKQKGTYGRINKVQHPDLGSASTDDQTGQSETSDAQESVESGQEKSPSNSSTDSDSSGGGVQLSTTPFAYEEESSDLSHISDALASWIARPDRMPLGAYEALRARYGVDVTNLGMLTTFNISQTTITLIGKEPWRLASLMGTRRQSYLDYIPARYGSSRALTAAVECVTARVCSKLMPPNPTFSALVMRLYSKALKELQKDIADVARSQQPDVLCAVELLSLHEIVDASRPSAWEHHVNGLGQLVQHRSPSSFKTGYEKALFLGHVGPIVTTCLIAAEPCYLDTPEWSSVWASMIDPDEPFLTDRSELTIKLRMHLSSIPSFFQEIVRTVMGPELFNPIRMLELRRRAQGFTRHLMDWDREYKDYCVRNSFRQASDDELSLRRELFGSAMECLTIQKRVLAVVDDDERLNIEVEVQALAKLITSMQEGLPSHSWLFVGHEINVAHLVTKTRAEWEETMDDATQEEKLLATRKRFARFMEMMLSLQFHTNTRHSNI
ncbi:hypothetical protein K431DRAFT_230947 [Polychaeton citri CBS 116435]|uniref:Uncharacterized protein n=1 Tax=Polychaeton citri CBS 116435 TaxID=1314669 RepID=A0A9P4UMW9_9PEZI|nr:hypothetical protein K431DRAFT_230947 [Polychaeton citri CBS 116435]